jgi:hypothetical protein
MTNDEARDISARGKAIAYGIMDCCRISESQIDASLAMLMAKGVLSLIMAFAYKDHAGLEKDLAGLEDEVRSGVAAVMADLRDNKLDA